MAVSAPRDRAPETRSRHDRDSALIYESDGSWRALLLDRLASLRAAVAIVGVLALVALGVAVWALLGSAGSDEGRRVSAARVRSLEQRVDELSGKVDGAASEQAVSRVSGQLRALGERVDTVERRQAGALQELDTQVQRIDQAIKDLQQRMDALERRQQSAPSP
jgi:hypothetical protein